MDGVAWRVKHPGYPLLDLAEAAPPPDAPKTTISNSAKLSCLGLLVALAANR